MKLDGDKLLAELERVKVNGELMMLATEHDANKVLFVTATASVENVKNIISLIKSGNYTID